ncbi:MAG: hypothetical protein QOH76_2032 [Thermoleophilaceae bacterium]|jgi:hypothetical protein|nr:hypothetical protein [Thermoleophilaceae bacterium]
MKPMSTKLTALAAVATIGLGVGGTAQARHGADDPAGHQRHGADDGKRHAKGKQHHRHHGRHHHRHGHGADDGPNHT